MSISDGIHRLPERGLVVRAEDVHAVAAGHVREHLHPPAAEGVRAAGEHRADGGKGGEAGLVGADRTGVGAEQRADQRHGGAGEALAGADRRRVGGQRPGLGAAGAGGQGHQAHVLVEGDHVGRPVHEPRQHALADHALDLGAEARVGLHVARLLLELHREHAEAVPARALGLDRAEGAARPGRDAGAPRGRRRDRPRGGPSTSASARRASSGSLVISSSTPARTAAATCSRRCRSCRAPRAARPRAPWRCTPA